jgi:drug/metabolite transporter (DMT)-like permease
VTSRYAVLIATLTATWGSSFMFIKLAVAEIEPTALMSARFLVAGAILVAFLAASMGPRPALAALRASWRPGLVLGAINAAIPFTLIGLGQKHIDSGVAAIALATLPLFTVLLAIRLLPSERATRGRLAGIAVGLAGIAVLTGAAPQVGRWQVAGTLAVVAAAFFLALAGLYSQKRMATFSGPVLATAFTVWGGLILLPFGLLQLPDSVPSGTALGAVAALAVGATAFGALVLFRLIRLHGSAKTSLVTYLMPIAALFYGGVLLDEPLTLSMLAGLALILAGVGTGSGSLRLPGRRAEPQPVGVPEPQ